MPPASRPTALRPRTPRAVALSELLGRAGLSSTGTPTGTPTGVAGPGGPGRADLSEVAVTGVAMDSRAVVAGDLYVALPGQTHHGARFAAAAVAAGAVAVLTDRTGAELARAEPATGSRSPVLVVDDPRREMAAVAAQVYGDPAERMSMFAVTGTNGKTTTSFLLDAALRAVGWRSGVIGTLGYLLDGVAFDADRTTVTTPESPELQALLAVLAEEGAQTCVMEVSSHALALHRADAITFDVAAFTNFGRDHLDFHKTVEAYFEAKALLFTPAHTRSAVVNVDDQRGPVLLQRLAASGLPSATVSLTDSTADYWVRHTDVGSDQMTRVRLRTPDGEVTFSLGLPGDYNVRNAATALAMIDLARAGSPAAWDSVDLQRAANGLAEARVPGRMERVDLGPGTPAVFVDFAHTPQAVAAALSTVAGRRRIVVLGAGGDRDPDKRGPIGAAAARGADLVVVTDDNPRTEDPQAIRRSVLAGAEEARRAGSLSTDVVDGGDRRAAIRRGLAAAGPGDVVLILGKGHEVGQELGGTVLPFSDVEVVRSEWDALSGTGARA